MPKPPARPNRRIRRRLAIVAAALAALTVGSVAGATAGSYADPEYLEHDLDNITRSIGLDSRGVTALLEPAQLLTTLAGGGVEWVSNLGTQLEGLASGRLFVTLGQLVPGAGVGEPTSYARSPVVPVEVDFAARTGALLHGRLWWDGRPGPLPAIVITSGSIQAPASAYHWAARSLAEAGYVVLTWDAQGQGESETFGHAPGDVLPTADGFPFQQEANFVDGTVDALRFLLSTPADPYVPVGWSAAAVAAHAGSLAGAGLSWTNPVWGAVDRDRIGLAGHSLGARAVSVVQQCSDEGSRWADVAACGGRSYPVRAVVAWDRLSGGAGVVPVVPAMDQQADGYFLNPVPAFEAPSPDANLGAFTHWRDAGVDTFSFTVRGGTHCEWSYIPIICQATSYGLPAADLYTTAWFDRYLHPDAERNATGGAVLAGAWLPDGSTGGADELPWRANFFSVRVRSAIACECEAGAPRLEVDDVRAAAGLSPVGDWAGANADRPAVRPAG